MRGRAGEEKGEPHLTGIPETFFRAVREETPSQAPEAEPGIARCPRLSLLTGARPSAASPLQPPAIRRGRAAPQPPAPLPTPAAARSLTHPRPASAATGASFPRSLPPVKLSPASLRPTPPSRSGAAAAATGRALPQRRLAPPRSHLGPAAAAAGGAAEGDGGGGSWHSQSAAKSQRPAWRCLRGAERAVPPRRDSPRGEGGWAVPGVRRARRGVRRAWRARLSLRGTRRRGREPGQPQESPPRSHCPVGRGRGWRGGPPLWSCGARLV